MGSQVIRYVDEFRAQLDQAQRMVTDEMADVWLQASLALDNKVDKLMGEVQFAMQNKQAWELTGDQWLSELAYYQELRAQTFYEYKMFQDYSVDKVYQRGEEQARVAAKQSEILMNYVAGGNLPIGYNRLNREGVISLYGRWREGSPLADYFSGMGNESWSAMRTALLEGMTQGASLQSIAERMRDVKNVGYKRGLMIARTEVIGANRMSTLNSYRESGAVSGYLRVANPNGACMACMLLDGTYYPVSDDMVDHPNGACGTIPIIPGAEEPKWVHGKEAFLKLNESEQREKMGARFFEEWKGGSFKLDDMISWNDSPVFGKSPQVTPLWQLLGKDSPRGMLSAREV